MCTITYLPLSKDLKQFCITDSRDEYVGRRALAPKMYEELDTQLYYPKDTFAGGTWMGIGRNHQLMCLMNGAFERHQRKTYYRKSRGVVVKELLASPHIIDTIKSYDLTDIEPFFALLFSWKNKLTITEFVWDGNKRLLMEVTPNQPKIWSAAMTYDQNQRDDREIQWKQLVTDEKNISSENVWDFHHLTHFGDKEGITINRGILQTTSISQYINLQNRPSFRFHSLLTNEEQNEKLIWR